MLNHSLISLGANQHDPHRQLVLACQRIQALPKTHIIAQSHIAITAAFGFTQQPNFFNQVIKIATDLTPMNLLHHLKKIERELGRVRRVPWGPRIIDIDILDFADRQLSHPKLTLPHPQIYQRPYVAELIQNISKNMVYI